VLDVGNVINKQEGECERVASLKFQGGEIVECVSSQDLILVVLKNERAIEFLLMQLRMIPASSEDQKNTCIISQANRYVT
jgi:hypothetical protein